MADCCQIQFCLGFILFAVVLKGVDGEYCSDYTDIYDSQYCIFGCCGDFVKQYCCYISVGAILGIVIGSIVFISIVISLIICCLKTHTYHGRVIGPNTRNNVTVIQTASSNMQYQPQPLMYHTSSYSSTINGQQMSQSQTTVLPPPSSYTYNNPTFQAEVPQPPPYGLAPPAYPSSSYGPPPPSFGPEVYPYNQPGSTK